MSNWKKRLKNVKGPTFKLVCANCSQNVFIKSNKGLTCNVCGSHKQKRIPLPVAALLLIFLFLFSGCNMTAQRFSEHIGAEWSANTGLDYEELVDCYDRQPEEIQELVKKKKIKIGMTKEQVILSWGLPKSYNNFASVNGSIEQWVYDRSYYGRHYTSISYLYLYFEDGDILVRFGSYHN